jgi:hypothetical protein
VRLILKPESGLLGAASIWLDFFKCFLFTFTSTLEIGKLRLSPMPGGSEEPSRIAMLDALSHVVSPTPGLLLALAY